MNEKIIKETFKKPHVFETNHKFVDFLKKYKWLLSLLFAVIVIFVIFSVNNSVEKAKRVDKIQGFLDGKTFFSQNRREIVSEKNGIYTFDGDTMSYEEWHIDVLNKDKSYKTGNINEYKNYRIKPSSDDIAIIEVKEGKSWYQIDKIQLEYKDNYARSINDEGREWSVKTLKEIEEYRKDKFCSHDWKEKELLREATCAKSGEKLYQCAKCKFEKTEYIEVDHKYSNGKCIECGAEKPKEKSNISADTWYEYASLSMLKYQNCVITSAGALTKAIVLGYRPVCSSCHIISEMPSMAAPEINYPVSKMYTCPECNETTMVKFKIED